MTQRFIPSAPPTSPVPPLLKPHQPRLSRMLVIMVMSALCGVVFGQAIGLRQVSWMIAADPNWVIRGGGTGIVVMATITGAFIGTLASPIIALALWRKNLLAALPLLMAVPLFSLVLLPVQLSGIVASLGVVLGAIAARIALPNAIRRYREGFCPACDYDLGGTDHVLCPECGLQVRGDAGDRLRLRPPYARRAILVLLAAVILFAIINIAQRRHFDHLIAGAVPITYSQVPVSTHTWPQGASTVNDYWNAGPRWRAGMVCAGGGGGFEADYVCLPTGDSDEWILEVLVPRPGAPACAPAMQLRLAYLAQDSNGRTMPYTGDPSILCDLNSAQALVVLEHDVPAALIEAMIDAAVRGGWRPLDPAHPFATLPHVVVDPTPHFQ